MLSALLLMLAGADAATPAATPKPGEDKEKLVCRREVPIGSLIASRKICLTKSQWEQAARDGNDAARKLVNDGTGKCFDPGLCPGAGR